MKKRTKNMQHIAAILLAFLLFSPSIPIHAETSQQELEKQLKEIEQQIAVYEKQLAVTTKEKNTLANKIKQLKLKQQELAAVIKQTTLKVTTLEANIVVTEKDLNANLSKEEKIKQNISEVIRMIKYQDIQPIVVLASGNGISSIFSRVQEFSNVTGNLQTLVQELKAVRVQIAGKKNQLEDQKSSAVNLLQIKNIQRQELTSTLTEQNTLLSQTKGKEENYKQSLVDSKKRAAEIRGRIYELFNTGKQVNFGQALDIAKLASNLTGVRPAFLLAVLTQESNLGKNVGTCNRAGDPPEKSWKVVMKPERDQKPFVEITESLGLNTDTTPVSCPMKGKDGKQIGWGGAMGPAQFIPSTWMGWKDKVAALTGKSPANPWDIRDAFVAAGLKLKSNGANGTEEGEWKAAMYYFSGSTNLAYRFYGDNVLVTAKKYQADIDALNQ